VTVRWQRALPGLGNCKFEDVTEKAGVGGSGFMTGAAWGDYDRDGFVDLFVSRYSHLDMNNLPQFGSNKFCRFKGILVQCGPWASKVKAISSTTSRRRHLRGSLREGGRA